MMTEPKNCTQEVLLTLILNGKVSIFDFPYLSGFRTRISDLRLKHGLNIHSENKKHKNKFNRIYTYAEHHLSEAEREKAIRIYSQLNNSI